MNRFIAQFIVAAVVAALVGCERPAKQPVQKPGNKEGETQQVENVWKFDDGKQTPAITLTRIIDGSNDILYVYHDEDGDWQFLDGGMVEESDAAMVALHEVVELDPTISRLFDLPKGWTAERENVNSEWLRAKR